MMDNPKGRKVSTSKASNEESYVGFFANIIPGIWNRISSHLTQKEFVPLHEAFVSNKACRSRWDEIKRTGQRLETFKSFGSEQNYAALKWVLQRGIHALDWNVIGKDKNKTKSDTLSALMRLFCAEAPGGHTDIVRGLVEIRGADVNMKLEQCVLGAIGEQAEYQMSTWSSQRTFVNTPRM